MLTFGVDRSTRAMCRAWASMTLAVPRGMAARSGQARRALLVVGVVCTALLWLGVAKAHAELAFSAAFGSEGAAEGQLAGPQGVDVDQTTLSPTSGDVYVADTNNARVEQFDGTGSFVRMWGWGVADGASSFEACTSACHAGIPGAGVGQLDHPMSVAVDSSSGPSQGDIYVGDSVNKVVEKFSSSGSPLATIAGPSAGTPFAAIAGVAVDASGSLWVAEQSTGIVYELDSSGTLLGQFNDTYGNTEAIAVDTSGDVYLIRGSGETEKWSPAARADGSPVKIDPATGRGLAVDSSTNNLYVDLGSSIDAWEASGDSLGNFGSGFLSQGAQMAYNPNAVLPGAGGAGALYVADPGTNDVTIFVPPAPAAPMVQPNSESAVGVTAKAATLNARVNADGLDTQVYFEYGPTAAYGTSTQAPPGADIGSNFGFVAASASLSGLSASTTYHFRVVATNTLGTTDGPDMTFTTGTPMAPTVNGESTANILSTRATLQAAITPRFSDTHYVFEYGPTAAYGTQIPLPPGNDIGEANSEQNASVALTDLQPQTTYHFRVVAANSIGSTDGADSTFTTTPSIKVDSEFATGVTTTTAALRAKVNPEGVSAHYRFEYGTTTSYGTDIPVPDGAIGGGEGDEVIGANLMGLQPSTKYYFRLVVTNSFVTESTNAQSFTTYSTGEPTILADGRAYELVSGVDKNGGDVGGSAASNLEVLVSGQSAWGHSSASGSAVTYSSFTSFGDAQGALILNQYLSSRGPDGWTTHSIMPPVTKHTELSIQPGYHFFTPELTAGMISWGSSLLAPGAPEGEFEDLYVRQMGAAPYELVTTVAPPNQINGFKATFAGASADLRHVVFDANDALVAGAPAGASSVYEWVAGALRLVSVLPGPGKVAAESAGAGDGEVEERSVPENAVSADGSRVFWTDNNGQLYVRENATTTVKLNASQRIPSLGDGSAVFLGATPDGGKAFFTDGTSLTSAPNDNGGLYEYDLSSGELKDLTMDGSGSPEVEGVLGISEQGSNVYFVARADLAAGATAGGYNLYLSRDGVIRFIAGLDSKDSNDWSRAFERRTARITPDGEHLAFLSLAPVTDYDNVDLNTGSPDAELFAYDASGGHLSCVSCNPSGVQPVGATSIPTGSFIGHIPRFISDDGRRLFFSSKDVLLPSDTNGTQNVYEYEDGALHMISSGTGEEIATFSDASANGDDLFFTTRVRLVPEDTDNSSDMYDARVGGGFPAPVSPQQCTGESCRGPLSSPPASLAIDTEAAGTPPESLPAQPSKTSPHKAKVKPVKHKAKHRKGARKSKSGRRGRRRGKGSLRKSRRRGHAS